MNQLTLASLLAAGLICLILYAFLNEICQLTPLVTLLFVIDNILAVNLLIF